MLAFKTLVATAVLAASAVPALASQVLLSFENLPKYPDQVGDLFKADGILFSNNGWVFKSQAGLCGGTGLFFGGNTSAVGCGAVQLSTTSGFGTGVPIALTINVDSGFTGRFSLLYTANSAGSVEIFDGLNGAGNKVSQAGLNTQPPCDTDPDFFCNWDTALLELGSATAKSVVIKGVDQAMFLDNMLFANVNAGTPPSTDVPEPGGVALSLAALGAMAWTRKRVMR